MRGHDGVVEERWRHPGLVEEEAAEEDGHRESSWRSARPSRMQGSGRLLGLVQPIEAPASMRRDGRLGSSAGIHLNFLNMIMLVKNYMSAMLPSVTSAQHVRRGSRWLDGHLRDSPAVARQVYYSCRTTGGECIPYAISGRISRFRFAGKSARRLRCEMRVIFVRLVSRAPSSHNKAKALSFTNSCTLTLAPCAVSFLESASINADLPRGR